MNQTINNHWCVPLHGQQSSGFVGGIHHTTVSNAENFPMQRRHHMLIST